MLLFLVSVGRICVAVGAFLMIAFCTLAGWGYGQRIDPRNDLIYSAIGLVFGIIISGSVFGLGAAIFDMQSSLREIAAGRKSVAQKSDDWSRERIASSRSWNEPKIGRGKTD